jgi:hypothetical protein
MSNGATAQELPDPMRPPGGWGTPSSLETATLQLAPGQLQMIVRTPGEQPWALIDGRRVNLGDRIDGERLVTLTATDAVLKGSDGSRRLSLTPGMTHHRRLDQTTKAPR